MFRKLITGAVLAPVLCAAPASAASVMHPEVYESLVESGSARVIVELDVPLPNRQDLGAGDMARLAAATAEVRAQVLADLGLGDRPEQTEYLPLLMLEASFDEAKRLVRHPRVLGVKPDRTYRPALDRSVPAIGAPAAWAIGGSRGSGAVVAVLDTGFDTIHEALDGKVVDEACFSSNGPSLFTLCPDGTTEQFGEGAAIAPPEALDGFDHGTHVAGIAAGYPLQEAPGVAPHADLALIQVFSESRRALDCDGAAACVVSDDRSILRGLDHVLHLRSRNFPIRAVNLSLSSLTFYASQGDCDADDPGYELAALLLHLLGAPVVAASGNDALIRGEFIEGVGMPACVSTVLAVGAINDAFDAPWLSSQGGALLDVLAPGESIRSSVPNDGYESWPGTSMAAPHVAGALALLSTEWPGAHAVQLTQILRDTGRRVVDDRFPTVREHPFIDLNAAARELHRLWPKAAPPTPTGLRLSSRRGTSALLMWDDAGDTEVRFEVTGRVAPAGGAILPVTVPGNEAGQRTAVAEVARLQPATTYRVQVRACDTFARCSAYSLPFDFTTLETRPPAPTGLRVTLRGLTRIDIAWNAQPGLTRWALSWHGGSLPAGNSAPAAATTTASFSNRLPNELYTFTLSACNADGCGPASTVSGRTDALARVPNAPSNLRMGAAAAGQIALSWTDNAFNEMGFEIWRAYAIQGFGPSEDNPSWALVASPRSNAQQHNGPAAARNTVSYYKVRACNVGGCSAFSNTVSHFQ